MNIIDALNSGKRIRRNVSNWGIGPWKDFSNFRYADLSKPDLLAEDWEVEKNSVRMVYILFVCFDDKTPSFPKSHGVYSTRTDAYSAFEKLKESNPSYKTATLSIVESEFFE